MRTKAALNCAFTVCAFAQHHGLNSNHAEDRNGTREPVGYTHLEEYLNSID